MKIFAFIFSAFFAAFAGIIQGSMLGSITLGMGTGNLLPAISTAMLGSTFIKPGIPNIPGTALGTVLLAVILNWSNYDRDFFLLIRRAEYHGLVRGVFTCAQHGYY